jgi:hypothetical protein
VIQEETLLRKTLKDFYRPLLANYSYFVPYYYFWERVEEHFRNFGNMLKNTLRTLGTWWKHFGKTQKKNPKKSKPF